MAEQSQQGQEQGGQEGYNFNAKPQVVNVRTTKFRDQLVVPQNIMFDKRVVRGNTYSSIVTQKTEQQGGSIAGRRKVNQKMMQEQPDQEDDNMASQQTQRKRENQEVQTDENVEELTDKPPNYEKECQTDFIIEKEVPRLYMKVKTGTDKETQVWDDGELFNFDYEVQPILSILIGKTLEQARMEVLEEEEVREMKEQQKYYIQLKTAEVQEQHRLEDVEQMRYQENLRRKQQYSTKKDLEIKAHQKLVSRVLAKQFLKKVQGNTDQILSRQGFYRLDVEVQLQQEFLPWLYSEVQGVLTSQYSFQADCIELFTLVEKQVYQAHNVVHKLEMKNRQDLLEEREKKRVEEEERRVKRMQAKKVRLEQERRQRLKEAVQEKMLSKSDLKPNSINYTLSDIDANQQTIPFIGLFGGFIGELIIFISALQELANENTQPSLKQLFATSEALEELINGIMQALLIHPELQIEIPVGQMADQQLDQKEPGLSIVGLNGVQTTSASIQAIIQENIHSVILLCMKQNYLTFGLSKDMIDQVQNIVLKICLTNELLRLKTKFVKVNSQMANFSQVCLSRIRPSLSDVPFNPKSGKSRPDQFDPDEEVSNPNNLAEAEIENKASVFSSTVEDLSILVQHSVSELYIRQLFLECLADVITLDTGSDYQIMVDATDKCEALQNAILDVIVPDIPVFDMGQY